MKQSGPPLSTLQTAKRRTMWSLVGDVMFRLSWSRLMIGNIARNIQAQQGEGAGVATQGEQRWLASLGTH